MGDLPVEPAAAPKHTMSEYAPPHLVLTYPVIHDSNRTYI